MTALLAALANGAMVSVPIAAVVWLVLRLAPRRLWNAATRYMVWWAALLVTAALPALFVPRPPQPTLLPPVCAAPGEPEPAAIPFPVVELPSVADPVSAPTPGRLHGPAFPIRISAIRWARWIPACWLRRAP